MWHMSFCSAVGFLAVRVLKLVKSHNMSARDYMQRVFPIGEGGCSRGGEGTAGRGDPQQMVKIHGAMAGAVPRPPPYPAGKRPRCRIPKPIAALPLPPCLPSLPPTPNF